MSDQTALSVPTEQHDKGVVLCPTGRVDGTNAASLQRLIQEQLDAGQSALVFDFTDLSYISSAGLRVLLVAARDAQAKGGKAAFCGLSKQIAEVFSVSGFDKILAVHAGRDEALEAI